MSLKRVFALLPVLFLLASCDLENLGMAGKFEESVQKTFDMKAGSTMSVSNFNGSIEILGWEQERVQVVATKYAGSEGDLKAINIEMDVTGDTLRIKTTRPSARWGNMGAKYVIRTPFSMRLDEIESSNGSVKIEDLKGYKRVRTSNGAIRLARIEGELQARTSNGSLEVYDAVGDVNCKTSNGTIKLQKIAGAVEAETSNGAVRVEASELAAGRPVVLRTSNGSIELAAGVMRQNDISANTSNGSITLRLPANLDARVSLDAGRGKVSSDFALENASVTNSRIEGVAGKGSSQVRAGTSNASIRLVKYGSSD